MLTEIKAFTSTPSAFWVKAQNRQFPAFEQARVSRCDIAIVGGGWVGLFAAHTLVKAGKNVVLIDKGFVGGEASGHSGGIILPPDDFSSLVRRCGKDITKVTQILKASHQALTVIRDIAAQEGFSSGDQSTGVITGFRTEAEANRYFATQQNIQTLLPDLYSSSDITRLTPEETGAAHYFRAGGAHSSKGRVINPSLTVQGLIGVLKKPLKMFEMSAITGFEPARRGVRVLVGHESLEAEQVILAGGSTSNLVRVKKGDGFPVPHAVMNGMLATGKLDDGMRSKISNTLGQHVPVYCLGIAAPYFRFSEDGRLLFGSGGRAGANEYPHIMSDVAGDFQEIFPELAKEIDPKECHIWGRPVFHSRSNLPYAFACDAAGFHVQNWPRGEDGLLRPMPIMGLAGLGDQGNGWGPFLGVVAGRAILGDRDATQILGLFQNIAPQKPLTKRQVQRQLAADRRM